MYPKIGQNIMVNITNESQSCKSLIAEIGEKEILIALPINTDVIGLLSVGTPIEISFQTGDNKYEFNTEVLGKTKDNISLFRVKKPLETEIVKIQLRENFRVNATMRVVLKEVEQSTINISAGGMLCSCNLDLAVELGDEVSGSLFLPTTENNEAVSLGFKGQVVRLNQVLKEDRLIVAINFIELDPRDQTKIIQYCFEKQRQMRMAARR